MDVTEYLPMALNFARDVLVVFLGVWLYQSYCHWRLVFACRRAAARWCKRIEEAEASQADTAADGFTPHDEQAEQLPMYDEDPFDEGWKTDPQKWKRDHGAE